MPRIARPALGVRRSVAALRAGRARSRDHGRSSRGRCRSSRRPPRRGGVHVPRRRDPRDLGRARPLAGHNAYQRRSRGMKDLKDGSRSNSRDPGRTGPQRLHRRLERGSPAAHARLSRSRSGGGASATSSPTRSARPEAAPAPPIVATARAEIRAEPAVAQILAAADADSGLWPRLIPGLREGRAVDRRARRASRPSPRPRTRQPGPRRRVSPPARARRPRARPLLAPLDRRARRSARREPGDACRRRQADDRPETARDGCSAHALRRTPRGPVPQRHRVAQPRRDASSARADG